MTPIDSSLHAWRHAMDALLDLSDGLDDKRWSAPTECPGWTVADIYAHLIGGESWMAAGHRRPERGLATIADEPVGQRRGRSREAVLAELREVYARRTAQLAERAPDPDAPAYSAVGDPVPTWLLLRMRAFDLWVHEQDVRRAIGRPGDLGAPGAPLARDTFLQVLPRIVARTAGAPPGSGVRLTVTGEVPVDVTVSVDGSGRGAVVPTGTGPVTAHLTMGWEAYSRLSCGRGGPADHRITIDGDRELAGRVLASLTVTP